MAKSQYSQDLLDTLAENPHIEKVYFTAKGNHLFTAFPKFGIDGKPDASGKLYANGTEVKEVSASSITASA